MRKISIGLMLALLSVCVWAAPNEAEQEAAWAAADAVSVAGPAKTLIAGQSEITIPKGYAFVPAKETAALMQAMGNGEIADLEGMLLESEGQDGGFYVIQYSKEGYIKDDDAAKMDADEILKEYKEGTEEGNKDRIAKGFAPIETVGWAQKPSYDANLHRLTWALTLRDKGSAAGPDDTVNYETRILGREGVLSMTWVASLSELSGQGKAQADQLTAGAQYIDGKKYGDYSASTGDKVAEYGLATLITGAVAKKIGLFGVIVTFLAKFAKFGFLAGLVGFWGLKKWRKKAKSSTELRPDSTLDARAETTVPLTPSSRTSDAAKQNELTDTTKL